MKLDNLRRKIDKIDSRFIILLAERMKIAVTIKSEKMSLGMHTKDKKRESEVMEKCQNQAKLRNLNPKFIVEIMNLIIKESKRIQDHG